MLSKDVHPQNPATSIAAPLARSSNSTMPTRNTGGRCAATGRTPARPAHSRISAPQAKNAARQLHATVVHHQLVRHLTLLTPTQNLIEILPGIDRTMKVLIAGRGLG